MQVIEVYPTLTFQALSDATRLRIMRLLAVSREEACLCELVDSLQESQYKLSRHLKILRQTGLLDATKDGRWVYHRLVTKPSHLEALFEVVASLPDPQGVYSADQKRFHERLRHRDDGRCRVGVLTEALKSPTNRSEAG